MSFTNTIKVYLYKKLFDTFELSFTTYFYNFSNANSI